MIENDKYDVTDLIAAAAEQKPDEFSDAFNSLILDRLSTAVETRKQEIAATMFDTDVAVEEPEEQ